MISLISLFMNSPLQMRTIDKKVLDFIVKYKKDNDGLSPTRREIEFAMNLNSTSYVNFCLQRLFQIGAIKLDYGSSRGIVVVGGKWIPPDYLNNDGDSHV